MSPRDRQNDRVQKRKRRETILTAATAHGVVRGLFDALKDLGPRYSLRWFAAKAKVPSSGYLSEVLGGRRLLSKKHVNGVATAFELTAEETKYLKLLLDRDHCKGKSTEKFDELSAQITAAKRRMNRLTFQLDKDVSHLFFAVEVFSVMSTLGDDVFLADIVAFYGEQRSLSVKRAVKLLIDFEMIERAEKGQLRTIAPIAHFVAGANSDFYEQFMKSVLTDAAQKLHLWFQRPDLAVFSSSLFSVDAAAYRARIPDIKQSILKIVSDLDQSSADSLVRLNVQMFPVVTHQDK